MTEYNGWKNRATWNVALWLNNDEGYMSSVNAYIDDCVHWQEPPKYGAFAKRLGLFATTPDGISFTDNNLDEQELDALLLEIYEWRNREVATEIAHCAACGDPIDFCQGHGELGDPHGFGILQAHEDADHTNCHPMSDCRKETA